MPKLAWPVPFLSAVILAAIFAGCGSDTNSPEVKKQIQERSAAIREDEEQENAAAKKRRGKKAAVVKSIKGRLGASQDDTP